MNERFEDRVARDPEGAWDSIKPIVEEMKAKEPLAEAVEVAIKEAQEAGFVEGARVKLKGDGNESPDIGTVVGFNEQTSGLYNGARYPVYVKWARGTFEYGTEALDLTE